MSRRDDRASEAPRAPSYRDRKPASKQASAAARASSKKADTRCEIALRSELWKAGCRFRKNVGELPGKPDIVFSRRRIVVFCDGDFWHGRNWDERRRKLQQGSNPGYWVEKIERNRQRDREHQRRLVAAGWTVLRFWETDILADPGAVAREILRLLDERGHRRASST